MGSKHAKHSSQCAEEARDSVKGNHDCGQAARSDAVSAQRKAPRTENSDDLVLGGEILQGMVVICLVLPESGAVKIPMPVNSCLSREREQTTMRR